MKDKCIKKTNILVVLYVLFALAIIISDFFQVLFGMDYIKAVVGAALIVCFLGGVTKKYFEIGHFEINLCDALFMVFLIIFSFLRGSMPDISFDTSNYCECIERMT